MIITNGNIHDAVSPEPYIADIAVRNGKIEDIAPSIPPQPNEEVLDATGLNIYPGLVEAHCHIGMMLWGSKEKETSEKNDPIAPHLRGIDAFYPFDKNVAVARESGVTTVAIGPGSASVVGGTFSALKTYGNCVDDMLVKENVAMKCAFGENPRGTYQSKSISTRMTIAAKLRELLFQTQEYLAHKECADNDPTKMPKFDIKLEAMIPVIKGEIPLKAHAHRADDICTAIRIAKEFNLRMTLEHCTEGHLITEVLQKAGFPVIVGPSAPTAGKAELLHKSFTTPGILANAGIDVSITTDAPAGAISCLPIWAGMAVKDGMDPFHALKAITINPAKHLGIEDRVGSIEVGKDADILLTDGDILSSTTKVVKVIIDGNIIVNA